MAETDDHYLRKELHSRIRSDDRLFEFLETGCLDGLWYWDLERPDQEWLSPRFKAVFGYEPDEIPHSPEWWQANIHADDLKKVLENFERHRDDPSWPYDQVVRYRHKSGKTVWIRCRGLIIRDEAGAPIRMLGAHTDVTAIKESELRLISSEKRYQEQLEMLQAAEELGLVGHWQFDPKCHRLFWSKQVFRIHGLDPDGPKPTVETAIKFYHPEDRPKVTAAVEQALQSGERYELEARVVRPDGSIRYVVTRGLCTAAPDGSVDNLFGIFLDVSERKAAEQRMAKLAYNDTLTGLANRTSFLADLEKTVDRDDWACNSVALLLIDLDRFKEINDTFGHPAGDEYLKVIGQRIVKSVSTADTVARLGGDEFAVVLTEPGSPDNAIAAAERIVRAVSDPLSLPSCGSTPLWPGCSVGVRFADRAEQPGSVQVLADADMALYKAKGGGRGQACLYDPSLRASLQQSFVEGQALHEALDSGSLSLHWQAFVSSRVGAYEGAEALLRWNHPDRGLIGPDSFALSTQDDALLRRIDLWVLRTALESMRGCETPSVAKGLISVNITGDRLANAQTRQAILEEIAQAGPMVRMLILEISEDVVLSRQTDQIRDALSQLRAMGVHIALDDFGTGKATLAHLKDLPLDFIKIAREFVTQMDRRRQNRVIVQAIIGLAHGLGAKTIAEGVERQEEAEMLRWMGCDYLQGYHVGRPMPLSELTTQVAHIAA